MHKECITTGPPWLFFSHGSVSLYLSPEKVFEDNGSKSLFLKTMLVLILNSGSGDHN